VLGYKPPKASQAVSPTPTPNFNKAELEKGVQKEVSIKTGKEASSKPDVNRTKAAFAHKAFFAQMGMLKPSVKDMSGNVVTGGVQRQIAASKGLNKAVIPSSPKPIIPGRGVANTASSNLNPNTAKIFDTGHKVFSSLVSPEPKLPLSTQVAKAEPEKYEQRTSKMSSSDKDASNKRTLEEDKRTYNADLKERSKNKPFQVAKAEPTMAKPVTKSPSSGPANTSTPKAASPIILKTPKL
jgi:hypothetical protein